MRYDEPLVVVTFRIHPLWQHRFDDRIRWSFERLGIEIGSEFRGPSADAEPVDFTRLKAETIARSYVVKDEGLWRRRQLRSDLSDALVAVVDSSPEWHLLVRLRDVMHQVMLAERAVEPEARALTEPAVVDVNVNEIVTRCEQVSALRVDLLARRAVAAERDEALVHLKESCDAIEARIDHLDRYQARLWELHLAYRNATYIADPDKTPTAGEIADLRQRALDLAAEAAGDRHLADTPADPDVPR